MNDPSPARNTDTLDFAAELQDELNKRGLAKVRAKLAPETDPSFDGEHCIDCPRAIPAKRLAMGKIRCVVCQARKEHQEKQHGR